MCADSRLSAQSLTLAVIVLTKSVAILTEAKRATVSDTPNSFGSSLSWGMTNTLVRADLSLLKSALSHTVAVGFLAAENGATPTHTRLMSAMGGRSTMPRNSGSADVGGGSVGVTVMSFVHLPPLSR